MIHAQSFIDECSKHGYNLFTGTPCSYLRPFINYVIDNENLDFIPTPNEGDAVALAAGAWLGGRKSIVMFQNSGLGNAVNPLTSLNAIMKIPFIGIVTLRGEVAGAPDEPQHELMGKITTNLLDILEIPWAIFPSENDQIKKSLDLALDCMETKKLPFFFVMKKDSISKYELKIKDTNPHIYRNNKTIFRSPNVQKFEVSRTQALAKIAQSFKNTGVILATTGKTGRELFEIEDLKNQFYMVGSMGCALSIGVGLSYTNYKGKIVVIDGDGALLMRMGNFALAGQQQPSNLIHILLDNGAHDSTGGQKTYSESIDFCSMAAAAGYHHIFEVSTLNELEKAIELSIENNELAFIRFFISMGSPETLGRPTVKPEQVALRLKNFITER